MCLRSRDYYSNGKYFSRNNLHRFINNCNCGECEECLAMKRAEWYLRMYWQARWIFDRSGYIIFDTMTYSDENLPRLDRYFEVGDDVNFSIVDKEDVTKFLKRLRMNLQRKYGIGRDRLKYFIASEYGDDKIYKDDYGRERKGTTRPHYHCLFFVDVAPSELDPKEFVKCVHDSWKLGNTDNYKTFKVPYPQYGKYLSKNIFCNDPAYSRNTDYDLRQVTNYVSKYIRKSDEYTTFVLDRVYKVLLDTIERLPREIKLKSVYDENLSIREAMFLRNFNKKNYADTLRLNYSEKQLYKDIKNEIMSKIRVFHMQSQGFGMYALENFSKEDEDYMLKSGKMRIDDADSESGKREIPIPMYYVRKLYYNYRRSSDGRVQWYLTDRGLDAMKSMTYGKIARLGKRYKDWFADLSSEQISLLNFDSMSEFKDSILNLLDGRSFYDLATYSLCYRGRILYQYHYGSDAMPSVEDIIDIHNEYNVITSDISFIRGDGSITIDEQSLPWDSESKSKLKLKDFFRLYCINENTEFEDEKRFRDFDMLLDIIRWTSVPRLTRKEEVQEFMMDYRERLKNFGMRVKI